MSKTFKLGGIFLISVVCLQLFRVIFSFINVSDNLANWLFSALFQGICMGILPYTLYRVWIKGNNKDYLKDLKIANKVNPLSFLLAIAIGFLVFYINLGASSIWYNILTILGYTYTSSVGTIYSSPEVLVFELLTSAVLPAIFEELTDRGLLLAVLDNEKDDKKVVLIIGIFFGFLHQNIAQLGPTMIGGVVMAYMAVKCRSILPGMIVHFMNNAIIVILDYCQQKGGVIADIYNAFYTFYSNFFLVILGTFALAVWVLIILLRQFEKINRPYRESDPKEKEKIIYQQTHTKPKKNRKSKQPQQPQQTQQSAFENSFNSIYGVNSENRYSASEYEKVVNTYTSANNATYSYATELPREKSFFKNWRDYGLVYCAFVSAALVTIFTYLWGLFR